LRSLLESVFFRNLLGDLLSARAALLAQLGQALRSAGDGHAASGGELTGHPLAHRS
jgi:hypothetical protein